MSNLSPATVKSNIQISQGAYLLSFERKFEFIPGQIIGLTHSMDFEPRIYSICSGNKEHYAMILYTLRPQGSLSNDLAKLKAGDKLFYTQPFGKFTCKENEAFFIATGSGIAPFASMLFSGMGDQKTLVHGNRYKEQLFFHNEFRNLLNHRYIPCTSREQADGIFYGRVSDYIKKKDELQTTIPYYLCGSAEMVIDIRELLINKGVPSDNVKAEIFF